MTRGSTRLLVMWLPCLALFALGCGTEPSKKSGSETDVTSADSEATPDDGEPTSDLPDPSGDEGLPPQDGATADTEAPNDECVGAEDGTPCDDNSVCTDSTTCQSGVCADGLFIQCEYAGPCKNSHCDPVEGCVAPIIEDGSPCTLGCFGTATCQAGECAPNEDTAVLCPQPEGECMDSLQCDPATGECTVEIVLPEGTGCDKDEDVCTLDACDAAGECVASGDIEACANQQQNNPCFTWLCNKKNGCQQVAFLEGNSCDDGNGCTSSDKCVDNMGGKLCLGTPLDIDDQNACTDDKCNGGAVTHEPLSGTGCDIGANQCATGQCQTGVCSSVPKSDGSACGDNQTCQSGQCGSATCAPACGECQFCDVQGGAASCKASGNGGSCNDDGNPCTDDVCNGGGCSHPNKSDGVSCGGGKICQSGSCISAQCNPACGECQVCNQDTLICQAAGNGVGCSDDGNPCTNDVCSGGGCSHPNKSNGLSCGGGKTCENGVCSDPPASCMSWATQAKATAKIHFTPGIAKASDGIHILGGSPHKQHLIFAPGSGAWSTGPEISGSGASEGAATTIGNTIWVADSDLDSKIKSYDVSSKQWTTGTARPTVFVRGPAIGHDGTNIYVIGGGDGNLKASGENHRYSPGNKQWTAMATMPTARGFVAHVQAGDWVYVIGGRAKDGSPSIKKDVEAYNTKTNNWSTKGAMPTARNGAMAALLNNKIYVAGGFSGSKQLKIVEVYDIGTNSWSACGEMGLAFSSGAAIGDNGKVLLFGGGTGDAGVQFGTPL